MSYSSADAGPVKLRLGGKATSSSAPVTRRASVQKVGPSPQIGSVPVESGRYGTPTPPINPWPRRLRFFGLDSVPRLLAVVLCFFAIVAGLHLRELTFASTGPVRFRGDISNGLNQGARVLRNTGLPVVKGERLPLSAVFRAWVATYDQVYVEGGGAAGRSFSLDYTPLRLLTMTLWVREVWAQRGATNDYDDAMTGPLMAFNSGCMLAAAGAMFLLVRHWSRRTRETPIRAGRAYANWRVSFRDWRARNVPWVVALGSALLVWFNAAAIIDAHGFPQWDVWLLPFYILSCYAASKDAWVSAGFLVVIGAMFKGQVLVVAPVLVMWPLLGGRPVAVLRMALGAVAAVAAVTWPWLVRENAGWRWIGLAGAGFLTLAVAHGLLLRRRRRLPIPVPDAHRLAPLPREQPERPDPAAQVFVAPTSETRVRRRGWLGMSMRIATVLSLSALAVTAVLLPSSRGASDGVVRVLGKTLGDLSTSAANVPADWALTCAGLATLGVICIWARPWRALPYVLLGVVAFGILMSGWRWGGSWSWYAIGFAFPTDHYQALAMGPISNPPALLEHRFGWRLKDPMWTPPWSTTAWTAQATLRLIFYIALTGVGAMLSWHARRNSIRTLLCFAAPWVLMFAIVPQMHERYFVWAAVVSSVGLALGVGPFLLHLLVTFLAFANIAIQILGQNGGWWPQANRFLGPMIPDSGWAVGLLALIYLYLCMIPPRRAVRQIAPVG